mmetsp:Transcript_24405/g.44121  ORF Transcript_24405/g.44121 Transcript_24405/m.44121 type:complete len:94 (-) Transcript_24405:547-828(-)
MHAETLSRTLYALSEARCGDTTLDRLLHMDIHGRGHARMHAASTGTPVTLADSRDLFPPVVGGPKKGSNKYNSPWGVLGTDALVPMLFLKCSY